MSKSPWRIGKQKFHIVCDDPKSVIAEVNPLVRDFKSNAMLIAAAPELFDALKIAEMQIKNDMVMRLQQPIEKEANLIILNVIANALAKAEGKSNDQNSK